MCSLGKGVITVGLSLCSLGKGLSLCSLGKGVITVGLSLCVHWVRSCHCVHCKVVTVVFTGCVVTGHGYWVCCVRVRGTVYCVLSLCPQGVLSLGKRLSLCRACRNFGLGCMEMKF